MIERDLKPGWRRVKFGDVVRQCKEKADPETSGLERYIAGDHMDTDDLRLRRWGEIGSGYLGPAFHMRFKPGQVLYGSRRTYLRKVAVAEFEGICANTTFVLESKNPNELSPAFLPFLMQTEAFNDFSVKNSKGSVNPYINFSDLAKFEFALPPMDEQSRMADLFVEIEAARESYETCVRSIEAMKASFASWCFSQAGNWESDSLRNLVEKLGSGKTPRGGETAYTQSGVIFLRSQNVYPGKLYLDDVARIPEEIDQQMASTRVQRDDVLLNITGASIGRCCKYDLDEPANVNQHVCILRPTKSLAPDFLSFYLQSDFGQRQIFKHQTKGNREGLNFQQLGSFEIPLPPMPFQESVVNTISELKVSSTNAEKMLLGLKALKTCVLAQSVI